MKLRKKYKFEASYVNKDGILGSSFEMFILFQHLAHIKEEDLKKLESFVDEFDHSIMFSYDDENKEFLSQSQRTLQVNCSKEEVDFYLYGSLIYNKFPELLIEKIEILDTKETTWFVYKSDKSYYLKNAI